MRIQLRMKKSDIEMLIKDLIKHFYFSYCFKVLTI